MARTPPVTSKISKTKRLKKRFSPSTFSSLLRTMSKPGAWDVMRPSVFSTVALAILRRQVRLSKTLCHEYQILIEEAFIIKGWK